MLWSLRGGNAGDKERIARLLELKRIKDMGGDYEAVLSGVSKDGPWAWVNLIELWPTAALALAKIQLM